MSTTSTAAAQYDLPKTVGRRSDSFAGFLALVLFVLTADVIATQVASAQLAYNPSLGPPVGHAAFLRHVYLPWQWATWAWQFGPFSGRAYPPHVATIVHAALLHGIELGTLIGAPVAFFGVFLTSFLSPASDVKDLSDSSGEWATENDVRREGLFAHCGPILGAFPAAGGWRTMRYGGDCGLTLTAPPGAGKTRGWLVVNLTCLLADPGAATWSAEKRRAEPWGEEPSHIVLDVKGYLAKATSGWRRAMGHDVFVLEPFSTSADGAKINPLWSIHVGGIRMYDHCYQAALDAVDADGKPLPTYWDQACTAFLAAVIGTLGFVSLYRNDPKLLSYPAVIDYICGFDSIEDLIENMFALEHDPHGIFTEMGELEFDGNRCAWISACTRAMKAKEKEERSGVFGTLAEKMNMYRSPLIRRHIMESTFTIRQLANSERPGVCYLSIPAMKLDHIRPFTRALVAHALRELTEDGSQSQAGREVRGNKRTVVLWLDEVAALKTVPTLASSAGFLRGYGVVLALFWQSTAQLLEWYGQNETISATLKIHAIQRLNVLKEAKQWSEALGSFSVAVTKRNASLRPGWTDISEQADIHSRPLLTPGEVMRIPRDSTVILAHGLKIMAKTFFWDKVQALKRRVSMPPVRRSSVIVDKPHFIERLEEPLGAEKVETLLSPPPEKPEPPAPEPSMLERHILAEAGKVPVGTFIVLDGPPSDNPVDDVLRARHAT
ncbi:MAG: type IV secretory system conjugative DNA transfer family protein [Candidatus Velthaea sp.]